jgi:TonB-linked SusC/RagA family outer membrane protein
MKKFLLLCFSFVFVLSAWAQERVITGRVTSSEDGSALPGVNVVVKGTTNGSVTDVEGKYSLSIPSAGGSLVFSFIGLKTMEVPVGDRTVVDVQLGLDVTQLTEVVVTAQGIQRETKALGFATTTISAALLAEKPESDVGRALQGRSPGIQILNSSGLAGSGSRINIRGNSSITGNTQPLWVVDGVPINTSSNNLNEDFRDGQVSPSRFLDIDPNNIESISILRGLSATTTYGSQGRNGVILVTTKTGAKGQKQNKFQGSIAQSYFITEAILPEYQGKWANGFDGAYGEFFSNWGSLFNGKPTGVRHPYWEHRNTFPQFPEFAITGGNTDPGYIPVDQPDNVKNFFKTGVSSTTSINLGTSNEYGNLSFSYSHLDDQGFIKYNEVIRDNFSLGGNAKLTKRLTLGSTFNYVKTDFKTPPSAAGQGSNSIGGPSVFSELFYTPRNIDLTNWPWENPVTHASVYYRNNNSISNPRWILANARQTSETNRFFSSSNINYKFTDWLDITYRLGWDTYTEKQSSWVNKGGVGFDANLLPGGYKTISSTNTILDHSFLASINKQMNQDIDLTGLVGFNYRSNKYDQTGLESLGQVVYGLIEHRNFTSTQAKDFRANNLNRVERSAIAGIFFDATVGYKDYLYINLSGRNDWSSTLEQNNRSLFYPGGSIAFVPTAAFPNFASNLLDFLKFRLAYGTSANFGDPYSTRPSLTLNAQAKQDVLGNVVTLRQPDLLANKDLKPELLTETEFGIESKLFHNRVRLDLSFYNRQAKDQIVERPLDPSSGYNSVFINAGTIENSGIEMSLGGTAIKTNDWNLDVTFNFTRNRSLVKELPEGSKEILINGFTNLGNFAIEGKPLNVIQGTFVEKSPAGELIVNAQGDYKRSDDIGIIADPNPDWLGSAIIGLSWKAFTFGMQWDYVHGGQTYSFSAATLVGRGVSRDLQSFDPTLPLILPGVREVLDASDNVIGYRPNDIPLTTSGVFFGNSIIGGSPDDRGVFDATRVRFREISLAYNLPKSLVSRLKLGGINVSLIGNNLWFRSINAPEYARADFDRTAFGGNNGAGFDFLGGPSARKYGINIKVTF